MDTFVIILVTACVTVGVSAPLAHAIGYRKGIKHGAAKQIREILSRHNERMGL